MIKDSFIRMTVEGLTLDPTTKAPVIILRDEDEELTLPIWVGLLEATSLATELEGVKLARPMTHDLLKTLVEELGARVERVEVTELRDNTFYASIHLDLNGEARTIDSRPSDAISLALRTESPIYVARGVLEASSIAAEKEATENPAGESRDISTVSPDEWPDILDKLDPTDFRYKM